MVYSDDKKAAVLAALLEGQSVSSVAKQYSIRRQTVMLWRDAAGVRTTIAQGANSKMVDLSPLIADYLNAALITLREQVEAFRDVVWLKSQSASEAAVLHGVLADKAIRILEAAERANASNAAEE